MNSFFPRWRRFLIVTGALAVLTAPGFWLQVREGRRLREELAPLRARQSAAHPGPARGASGSAAALDTAAAETDREAIVRLRAEIDRLRVQLRAQERALAGPPPALSPLVETFLPVISLPATTAADGTLLFDADTLALLEPYLRTLPEGSEFALRAQVESTSRAGVLQLVQSSSAYSQIQKLAQGRRLRTILQVTEPKRAK